ncbi:Hypothetical protein PHPALM_5726, partial [Phytophthora palmivora]
MVELSFLARLVLTLLLSVLSLFIYKWLQSPPAPQSSVKRSKKRIKKKSKKSAASDSPSPPQQSPPKPQMSFKSVWRELKAEGRTRKPPPRRSLEDRYKYIRPAGHANGTVGIDYFLGEESVRVACTIEASLPSAACLQSSSMHSLTAMLRNRAAASPPTVLELRKGNEYHLKYDDGEVEYRVPAKCIKSGSNESDESGQREKGATN